MTDYKSDAKASRSGKMKSMGCYAEGGTVGGESYASKSMSGKGSKPEKDQSRYGGSDLPSSASGSNSRAAYDGREELKTFNERMPLYGEK